MEGTGSSDTGAAEVTKEVRNETSVLSESNDNAMVIDESQPPDTTEATSVESTLHRVSEQIEPPTNTSEKAQTDRMETVNLEESKLEDKTVTVSENTPEEKEPPVERADTVRTDTEEQPMETDELKINPVLETDTPEESNDKAAAHKPENIQPTINGSKPDDTTQIVPNVVEPSTTPVTKSSGKCYCDRDRDLNVVELQCGACFRWFHQHCITIPVGKCLPFMTNYTFVCKNCNPAGTESFVKRQSNFSQICMTAIANLMQESISQGKPKSLFSRDKEIVPFIDRNWPYLTTMQRRIKQTWHNTVQKTMLKDSEIFVCEESLTENNLETQQLFGIAMQDLYKIAPDYENKSGHNSALNLAGLNQASKSRGAKRKVPSDNLAASASKKPKSDLVIPKLPPHGYPLEHPFNKDGYRYILAEPDPHAPFRQEFDESSDWAGKPIPGWLYRTLVPNSVLLAMHDRGPQLKISEDRLSVVGEKGYCMVRGTHGVGQGSWYFECTIDDMPEGSATRLGWSLSLGNLQAPLGFDKFSYSIRSRKGTKFHQSCGHHYLDGGYGQGDVMGFLIELPPEDKNAPPSLPPTYKEKPLVKFKSYLYFEEKDEVQQALKELHSLPGGKITFFKNGVKLGVAWENIYAGIYFPAISLYKSCTVSVNFGPNLKYPPTDIPCSFMYEAAHKALIDQTVSDLVYFTENDGKLRLDNFMS